MRVEAPARTSASDVEYTLLHVFDETPSRVSTKWVVDEIPKMQDVEGVRRIELL